ncbi:MAG: tRNA (adenosine(37)-N6)-dimethylallyltransferase MiaA [Thermoanaerobaculia bacterium]|nr:tRNA (adenosine(37)-N6)-dimethylallyltransferase MiaA [Thermoanaerobaculia bacterium]
MERCIAVVGATCTGKSGLAMALAKGLRGEIVNADALQVYRGFDIGTAKPTPAERRAVPHHLIDVLEPEERYSAGEFARRARPVIADVLRRGGTPIVVGGSGLYLRALFTGLHPMPPISEEVRRRVRGRMEGEGLEAAFAELRSRDPATAARLQPADRQRIARALEVLEETGRPLSSWRSGDPTAPDLRPVRVGLTLPRTLLYDRIASRARQMLRRGWLEEVRGLLEGGVAHTAPAFQAIGYRQLLAHLEGRRSLEAAMEDTIRETRRYAKRQQTWFRREPVDAWFPASTQRALESDVMTFLRTEVEG